ncbi:MAG: translation initiation factor IF-2 [Candidatus Nanoarchaeia archaeon]|nr:translation initiation factor IF-2 [Candidatus Haiyanarchaeum thermophilum]MCW1303024.1 translation initiation factor IF-2 [Candidatus Haiyanarchaeum thermophilum]MCW1303702.1 translation initiation factor IF-2 [Candidatus Haiyanarchaeum thermophilum]MCW1306382.1 translation initiation factor IF-2 [Candidatus Haiyanarchaeum thermophilum]MCW1307108.1 translation initiation factor IF-2 [Candidatus Haiyanarchaeum thermophilum]
MLRAPIVTVLGHIDAGKTTLLDKIRGTAIAQKEIGGITQHIGATEIPIEFVERICGEIIKGFRVEIKIRSILFIDTPGHEAFTNLRRRGGSIADIAIVVVDINEGVQEQTREAIEISRAFQVPFFIALTKIDTLPGWRTRSTFCFSKSLEQQTDEVKFELEKKIALITDQLAKLQLNADLFSRVRDYAQTIPIVPCSGVSGEGIGELLLLIIGYAQKFLPEKLKLELDARAEGNVLEVKEEKGVGKTLNVILYRGKLRVGDWIVIGSSKGAIVSRVKAILKPMPLQDMREKCRFYEVDEALSACGIKLIASNVEDVIAGMPFIGCAENEIGEAKKRIEREVSGSSIEVDEEGVIVKADTLGTLEAIVSILRRNGIKVRKAEIGEPNRNDLIEAIEMRRKNLFYGVIMLFNVKVSREVENMAVSHGIKLLRSNVIYKLAEEYEEWVKRAVEEEKRRQLEKVTTPFKIRVLPGFIFRQSKPAIVGIEVLAGKIRSNYKVMREDGKPIGIIQRVEQMGQELPEAREGERVAVSIDGAVIGRNVKEGSVLISDISEEEYSILTKLQDLLTENERAVLEKVVELKRSKDPLWGVKLKS